MNEPVEAALEAPLLLGRLSEANHIYCNFEPLAELVEGGWVDIEDRALRFPRGGVRTKPAELGHVRHIGSLWVFTTTVRRSEADVAQALKPIRAIPVVDLSDIELSDARRRLLDSGVSLPEHQERAAVVLFKGDVCAHVKFGPSTQRAHSWTARLPDGKIELRRTPAGWSTAAKMRSGSFVPARGEALGDPVRIEDWSTDAEFLARVAEALSAAATALSQLMGRGAELNVRRFEKSLIDARLTPGAAGEWKSMIDRLRAEWPSIGGGAEALRSVGALLLDSEDGRRLLQIAVERRIADMADDLELRAQLDVADRLAPARNELKRLQAEIDALRLQESEMVGRAAAISRDIDQATLKLQAQVGKEEQVRLQLESLTQEVDERRNVLEATLTAAADATRKADAESSRFDSIRHEIDKFADQMSAEFEAGGSDESGRLNAFAQRLRSASGWGAGWSATLFPSVSPPWWSRDPAVPAAPVRMDGLAERVRQEADLHGLDADDLLLVDAFARAGELVVLSGSEADLALEGYSRAVAGGRVRTVSLDPGVIGVDDLWRTPVASRPTPFAWAWQRALGAPDRTFVVCLRGIDMAPSRMWMPALDAALRSADRPRNLIVLATLTQNPNEAEHGAPRASSEWFHSYAVALRVRACEQAGLAAAVLGNELPPATNFVQDSSSYELPYKTLRSIADRGAPQVVRRVVRFLKILGGTCPTRALTIARSWSAYLIEGSADSLPSPLTGGDEDVSHANFLH